MKTVQEIYGDYRIMPSLQLHQLRVAAVGKMICEHFDAPLEENDVIIACLFHDMGNIIKSDLVTFPELIQPEGYDYWKKIKEEWHMKYGDDEHHATNEIAREIGLAEPVRSLIDETRFSRLEAARDGASFESKILKYSDLRAGPFGILPMEERLEEGRVRYAERKAFNTPEGKERFRRSSEAAREIEKQVFAHCSIKPEVINDETIVPLIEELRNYSIE